MLNSDVSAQGRGASPGKRPGRSEGVGKRVQPRRRIDLEVSDFELLEVAAAEFDLPRSEVMRRLIRAALEVGPALSQQGHDAMRGVAMELRAANQHLRFILMKLHEADDAGTEAGTGTNAARGDARGPSGSASADDALAVWNVLFEQIDILGREVQSLLPDYGRGLRLAGSLQAQGAMAASGLIVNDPAMASRLAEPVSVRLERVLRQAQAREDAAHPTAAMPDAGS